jgi:hypothetical protein
VEERVEDDEPVTVVVRFPAGSTAEKKDKTFF